MIHRIAVAAAICSMFSQPAIASDWSRFRGPNGSGVCADGVVPPTTWDENQNLKWKTDLPGPGLSSPIVIGDRIVITCWSGYGVDRNEPGKIEDLKRNVVCLDRSNGQIIWQQSDDPVLPEDQYSGMFAENGYASHTPATDGKRVYVFFGKSGVIAYNLSDGKQLWKKSVGENREQKGWGTASSPIIYKDLVIVPAFIESDSLVAFNGTTGEVAWEQKTPGYTSNWSTPILVEADTQTDLVLAVPGEVWGMNPETGKLRWYCEIEGSDSARASVVADGDLVIAMAGGRGAQTSVAVKAGGKGAIEPIWTGRDISSIASPVLHDGKMYVVSNKVATSVDISTGKRIAQTRLTAGAAAVEPAAAEQPRDTSGEIAPRGGRGGYGGRSGGGGPGGQDYSSPILAGSHLYYTSRTGDTFVVEVGDEMKQVGVNTFASDRSDYSATPAISNGEIFIRSAKAIYCVAGK